MSDAIGPGEAARRLGVSTRTVQRWLREGRLPSVKVGSRVKVDASALADSCPPADLRPSSASPRKIGRLLVANRGELVVRIARTCRQLGIRSLALVAEDQARAWWTGATDEIVPSARQLPRWCGHPRRGARVRRRRDPPRLRLPGRERRVRRGRHRRKPGLDRPTARSDACGRRQGRCAQAGRAARRPVLTGYDGDDQSDRDAHRRGRANRFPGAGQAERRRWRQGHARGGRACRDGRDRSPVHGARHSLHSATSG